MKTNYTRFLVLRRADDAYRPDGANKASVNFHTDHSRGSLARVLTIIAEGGINLSKLQSMPIPGTEFRYSFHADMEFDHLERFTTVMDKVRSVAEGLNIYGVYKNGKNF